MKLGNGVSLLADGGAYESKPVASITAGKAGRRPLSASPVSCQSGIGNVHLSRQERRYAIDAPNRCRIEPIYGAAIMDR